MTKEELLAKAIRNYPEGTIHGGYNDARSNGYYTVRGELKIESNNSIFSKSSGCIYYAPGSCWAKIISYPVGYSKSNYYFY